MGIKTNYISIGETSIAYTKLGKGKIDLVIEMGLGSSMGEWWHIANRLAEKHTVLLYERAGCGNSQISKIDRTPKHIAQELYKVLQQLEHDEKIIILAHSQGGLYANQFARLYPELVKALVLLDPLSAQDNKFKTLLTEAEYKKSGVDKTSGLKMGYYLTKCHLGFIMKKIMATAPPFYYYNNFSKEAKEYILTALTKSAFYQTALEEYRLAHDDNFISELKGKDNFPEIPIVLITHNSKIAIKEIMEFGRASEKEAKKVEEIWQGLMKEYLSLSGQSIYFEATNSSHSIHLTDLELVIQAIERNI